MEEELSQLTLCSLKHEFEPQIMKLQAYHKKRKLGVLVDCGSSLNLLDLRVAKGLGCVVEHTKPIKVMLADGTMITTSEMVQQFEVKLQGYMFPIEIYLLPLNGYEVMLGIPWLQDLGDIVWNFNSLTIEFTYRGSAYRL